MSASTKSKPESASSPASGDAPDESSSSSDGERSGSRRDVEIEFEVSRQRFITHTVMGFVIGALCVWKLGTVGVWAGVALIAFGAWRAFQLVQTFMNAPGTIVVSEKRVVLPRGRCVGKPLEVVPKDVTAAYLLRRSVPWQQAAPVLVIEIGGKALTYPRDWFATEADQREILNALVRADIVAPAVAE